MVGTKVVDLRSDTVTRPDARMRRAMAEAVVGDDVLGEDPTVLQLEEESAAAVGKEAALFVPSGTMGNEIALHLHARPGSEVICEAGSHVFNYEMAGMAALSGLLPRPVVGDEGTLTAEMVETAIAPDLGYLAPTGVLSLENSANMAGGTVSPLEVQAAAAEVAHRHGLPVHLDGARIFNAALALGSEPADVAASADSVMFCLSKGLGAPAGSMLCGSRSFITEARRVRKMFGGGMRQVGVLAAAGLVALREGPQRLGEDHARARRVAEVLLALPGVKLVAPVETNIVIAKLMTGSRWDSEHCSPASAFVSWLSESGILALEVGRRRVRLVTHCDVQAPEFDTAMTRLGEYADAER